MPRSPASVQEMTNTVETGGAHGVAIATLREELKAQAAEIATLKTAIGEIEKFLGFLPGSMARAASGTVRT